MTKDQNAAAALVLMLCFKTTGKRKAVPLTLLQMAAGDERVPSVCVPLNHFNTEDCLVFIQQVKQMIDVVVMLEVQKGHDARGTEGWIHLETLRPGVVQLFLLKLYLNIM